MPSSFSSIFKRSHYNLILMLKFEHIAAFSVLSKKVDKLVSIVCIVGKLHFPDELSLKSLITEIEYK